jgi:6-phosphogluconolactonase (cycloisomerase 2 family)
MSSNEGSGAVYVQTNEAENTVITFRRGPEGALERIGDYATGGAGSGAAHLPSQGSVSLSGDGRRLLVSNAASGDVSLFAVSADGLELLQTLPTGEAPRSVAEHDGLVYVLNAGDPSLVGFRLADDGLEPLAGSRTELPSDADPAQVGFTPDGSKVVVTERGTNAIAFYAVGSDGRLGDPQVTPSSGPTPYGFAFANGGVLVVTEAFGAQKGKAAASSYIVSNGSATPVSRSVGNGRSEICWAVASDDGRYAFTTNFADGAVSRYAIEADGSLALEDAVAGTAIDGATGLRDEDISRDGRFLYAIDADSRRIFGWGIDNGGRLSPLGSWEGLPETVAGLAAS